MARTLEGIIKDFSERNEISLPGYVYTRMREYDRMIKSERITIDVLMKKLSNEDKLKKMRGTKEWKRLEEDIEELF